MKRSILVKDLPDYYPTMYMDGYTPQEILQAHRNTFYKKVEEREAMERAEEENTINIVIEVKK